VTADGYLVQPAITVPNNATQIVINEAGQVYVRTDANTDLQLLGQLTLGTFVNEVGLEPMGGNLYRETLASGNVTLGVAGDPGYGTIHQGYLENSNVDPVKEITELISAQRAYEMNSKVIQAADDMFATVAKNLR
jgi:flagellar basal-body rod protein FlgG